MVIEGLLRNFEKRDSGPAKNCKLFSVRRKGETRRRKTLSNESAYFGPDSLLTQLVPPDFLLCIDI